MNYTVNIINGNSTVTINDYITEGKITKAVNAIDSFTASVYWNETVWDLFNPLKTKVVVLDGNVTKFEGRILTVSPKMDTRGLITKQIVCEGTMGYLCDSVQPYTGEREYSGDTSRNGLEEFIDVLLTNHNSQVENDKKIYRGSVTVTTFQTLGVYKGLNYESTWQAIQDKLIKSFGGEINLRKSNGKTYLDYKPKIGATRTTQIKLGENMQSAEKKLDATQVCSRLIPLGAKLTITELDEQGQPRDVETEERLTIASVNDDKIYIESSDALTLYGICYKTVIYDDIHDPNILKTRGTEYLATQNTAVANHTITAVDLSYLGESVDEIEIFDSYPVVNTQLGISSTLEVVKKVTDIYKPFSPVLTFGSENVLLSDIINGNAVTVADEQNQISKTITETKNSINNVYSYVNDSAFTVQTNASGLVATATSTMVSQSDYEKFTQIIKNILKMDADGTTMIFKAIDEAIAEVDGKQESNYAEITKYIRFADGEIILGEVGNALTLTISNDMIYFKQNGVTVAYFSDNKLQVTDAVFNNSLQLGNFAFKPRENGNLSFVRVGETV